MPPTAWVDIKVSKVNLQGFSGALRIAGFYSDDDVTRHVLVATAESGKVFEVFYSTLGLGSVLIDNPGVVVNDISGFYAPKNKGRFYVEQFALTDLGSDGYLTVTQYAPEYTNPVGPQLNPNGPPPERISALYNLKTHVWHVVYLLNSTAVREVVYNPSLKTPNHFNVDLPLSSKIPLTTYKDVAAFYTSDDNYKHAILLAANGELFEVYWSNNDDETKPYKNEELVDFPEQLAVAFIGTVPGGATAVSAFYVEGAQFSRRIVAASPQGVFEFAYDPKQAVVRAAQLDASTDVIDIAGFYSPDDGVKHAIVLLNGDGVTQMVRELYYLD